jgi:hypothetical protein
MDEAHSLLAFNVPAQLVKDIVSVRALWRFGGWAIDLDILAVRQIAEWLVVSGYRFAQQPPRIDRFEKTCTEIVLAILKMPRQSVLASESQRWIHVLAAASPIMLCRSDQGPGPGSIGT